MTVRGIRAAARDHDGDGAQLGDRDRERDDDRNHDRGGGGRELAGSSPTHLGRRPRRGSQRASFTRNNDVRPQSCACRTSRVRVPRGASSASPWRSSRASQQTQAQVIDRDDRERASSAADHERRERDLGPVQRREQHGPPRDEVAAHRVRCVGHDQREPSRELALHGDRPRLRGYQPHGPRRLPRRDLEYRPT